MRSLEQWLVSEESGMPFSHCIHCRMPLLEIAQPWLVNKEYLRGECVLEYAICKPCREGVTARLSEESKRAVRQFLEREIDWKERVREFMLSGAEARLEACVACRKGREECEGFGLSALFDDGGELVTGPLPLILCNECIARIVSRLSDESREVWSRFLAEHFEGPSQEGFSGLL